MVMPSGGSPTSPNAGRLHDTLLPVGTFTCFVCLHRKNEPMMCNCVNLDNECQAFRRGVYKEVDMPLRLWVAAALAMR